MATVKIFPYYLTIHKKGEPKALLPVAGDANTPSVATIVSGLEGTINTYANMYMDDERALKFEVINTVSKTHIDGYIAGGDRMTRQEIIDIQTRKKTGVVTEGQIALAQFYYQIRYRQTGTKAVVFLQQTGNRGIKETFLKALSSYTTKHYPNLMLSLGTALPKNVIDAITTHGELTEVRLIKHGVPANVTDILDTGNTDDPSLNTTLVFAAKTNRRLRNDALETVARYWSERQEETVKTLFSFANFDYDDVRLKVVLDKTTRSIDVKKPDAMSWSEVVSDRVAIHSGRLELSGIRAICNDLAASLI